MPDQSSTTQPPVCDYEGSDYQSSFWERGGREYEDRAEAIALKRLLPRRGRLLLELGAGAGRNTPRYLGFERIVLLDYSRTQLQQAQSRLGTSDKYVYVAADIYRLPFIEGAFDAATMIRTLHHMAEPTRALSEVRAALAPGAVFILEFANKLNAKAVLRYWLRKQSWSPFDLRPVEFASLNFDFHPRAVRNWLQQLQFKTTRVLTVSHFRAGILKRLVPASLLAWLDSLFQWTGAFWQYTPSVFIRAVKQGGTAAVVGDATSLFKCPACGHTPLEHAGASLQCRQCGRKWHFSDGIYDFREPAP
jgi:ubiquinone/menaquinone biosynthesis C-methylase UbiE